MQREGNSRPPGQMLDCRCDGQYSHENQSRTVKRHKPFVQAFFILNKIVRHARKNGTVHKTRLICVYYVHTETFIILGAFLF